MWPVIWAHLQNLMSIFQTDLNVKATWRRMRGKLLCVWTFLTVTALFKISQVSGSISLNMETFHFQHQALILCLWLSQMKLFHVFTAGCFLAIRVRQYFLLKLRTATKAQNVTYLMDTSSPWSNLQNVSHELWSRPWKHRNKTLQPPHCTSTTHLSTMLLSFRCTT